MTEILPSPDTLTAYTALQSVGAQVIQAAEGPPNGGNTGGHGNEPTPKGPGTNERVEPKGSPPPK